MSTYEEKTVPVLCRWQTNEGTRSWRICCAKTELEIRGKNRESHDPPFGGVREGEAAA